MSENVQNRDLLQKHQMKVKCRSQCLIVLAYIILVAGWFTIIVNLFALFSVDSFRKIGWYNEWGYNYVKFDKSYLVWMFLLKIAATALVLCQGKKTLKVFKPTLQEYKDAEAGVTAGIPMTERKSRRMFKLKRKVKCVTAGLAFVIFVTCVASQRQFVKLSNSWLSDFYDKRPDLTMDVAFNSTESYNSTNSTYEPYSTFMRGYEPRWEDDDEFRDPFRTNDNGTIIIDRRPTMEDPMEPEYEPMEPEYEPTDQEGFYPEEEPKEEKHHKRHHYKHHKKHHQFKPKH